MVSFEIRTASRVSRSTGPWLALRRCRRLSSDLGRRLKAHLVRVVRAPAVSPHEIVRRAFD